MVCYNSMLLAVIGFFCMAISTVGAMPDPNKGSGFLAPYSNSNSDSSVGIIHGTPESALQQRAVVHPAGELQASSPPSPAPVEGPKEPRGKPRFKDEATRHEFPADELVEFVDGGGCDPDLKIESAEACQAGAKSLRMQGVSVVQMRRATPRRAASRRTVPGRRAGRHSSPIKQSGCFVLKDCKDSGNCVYFGTPARDLQPDQYRGICWVRSPTWNLKASSVTTKSLPAPPTERGKISKWLIRWGGDRDQAISEAVEKAVIETLEAVAPREKSGKVLSTAEITAKKENALDGLSKYSQQAEKVLRKVCRQWKPVATHHGHEGDALIVDKSVKVALAKLRSKEKTYAALVIAFDAMVLAVQKPQKATRKDVNEAVTQALNAAKEEFKWQGGKTGQEYLSGHMAIMERTGIKTLRDYNGMAGEALREVWDAWHLEAEHEPDELEHVDTALKELQEEEELQKEDTDEAMVVAFSTMINAVQEDQKQLAIEQGPQVAESLPAYHRP